MSEGPSLEAGQTVKAGQILLFTSGSYSDFIVNGIYRAKVDFVIPAKINYRGTAEPDIYGVSADPALVEEIDYFEVWRS